MLSKPQSNLNSSQSEAVNHTGGPLLVLAGAGSGKTRIITERIALLIGERKVKTRNILAVTFTNKAANEMKGRIDQLLPNQSKHLWIGTFHAICLRILKKDISNLEGFRRDFVIYDESDQIRLIKQCMTDLNIGENSLEPKSARSYINGAKSRGLDLEEFVSDIYYERVSRIYDLYEKEMRKSNALDFGDLLSLTVKLFSEKPEILESYQEQFHHILVDEYQDTNHVQYKIIEILSRKHRNLFIVGDDNQSIYGWRGADLQNILNFEKDFSDAKTVKLEKNYRSTETILNAANELICKNRNRSEKELWTERVGGDLISYYVARDEKDEAEYVSSQIRLISAFSSPTEEPDRLLSPQTESRSELGTRSKYSYNEVAVLFRTNNQSRLIEAELSRSGIPYVMVGGVGFYQRSEIKDLMAYLKIIANPLDNISLKRIINMPPRGIGKATTYMLGEIAKKNDTSLFDAIRVATNEGLLPGLPLKRVKGFYDLINALISFSKKQGIGEFVNYLLRETGYDEILEKEEDRRQNVGEMLNIIAEFEKEEGMSPTLSGEGTNIHDFLAWISLASDFEAADDEETDRVALMTLHKAKGLEFPVVFIVGLEEKLLPHINSTKDGNVEEERRLLYVGLTRAMDKLYLSSSSRRSVFGTEQRAKPSRFISELPAQALKWEVLNRGSKREDSPQSPMELRDVDKGELNRPKKPHGGANADKNVKYKVGQKASHAKFGQGIVEKVEGTGYMTKVSVFFPGYGIKKIIAGYLN